MLFSKIYQFDRQALQQVEVSKKKIVTLCALVFLLGGTLGYAICHLSFEKPKLPQTYDELVVIVDDTENELVSPAGIYGYMKEIGIKYPEIVWSQVALESQFKSNICLENHNYFGMKKASCRPNVQTGENLGHATYRNWKMSVLDYALWQSSTGVWKLKSEVAYFNYLSERYAEDPSYALKVKEIRDNFEHYLNVYDKKFKR
jgi:hypothetical protein